MEEKKESKFNMSQLILLRLNNMQTLASDYYRRGLIDKWYFEWRNIKLQIIGKLNETERTNLTTLETKVNKQISKSQKVKVIESYVIALQELIENKKIGLIDSDDSTVFT